MLIISSIVAAFFVLLGVTFSCGKGGFLIAGYNTSSPEEKEEYDEKALCRATGCLMFAFAACAGVVALSDVCDCIAFLWVGIVLYIVVAIGGVIYMNTSKKVKRK